MKLQVLSRVSPLARMIALGALSLVMNASQAAVDVFVKLYPAAGQQSIKGDSRDTVFNGNDGWFEISGFGLGASNTVSFGAGGGGMSTGKATFKEFTIQKQVDRVSPIIFGNLVKGQHFLGAKVVVRRAGFGGDQSAAPYLEYHFNTVFVTNQDWAGPGDEGPAETLTFQFAAIKLSYKPQNNDGTLGQAIVQRWDQVQNKAVFEELP